MDDLLSNTLITGAGGMIGSYIDFGVKTDRESLDIVNSDAVLAVFQKHKPDVIIHLAAETDMAICEKDPLRAYNVNVIGTYNIAKAAKLIGTKLVYVSTDAVFDGVKKSPYFEDDMPNPQNVYGRSKYLGELIIQGLGGDYLIVRTSWIFGGGPEKDKKFVAKIMNQLKDNNIKEIKVINDVYSSPTFAKDFVNALKNLILNGEKGIFHIVNSGVASRYDVAKELVQITGSHVKLVSVSAGFFPSDIKAINTGGLASKKIKLRSWQEALEEYVQNEWL